MNVCVLISLGMRVSMYGLFAQHVANEPVLYLSNVRWDPGLDVEMLDAVA